MEIDLFSAVALLLIKFENYFLLIKQETTAALVFFKNICGKGIALQIILSDFLMLVHKISLLKSCPQSNIDEPLHSDTLQKNLVHTPLSKLQQYFQILLEVEQQRKQVNFHCSV